MYTTKVYPKPSPKFDHLVAQCTALGIPIWRSLPENVPANAVVIDALFGFSYRGPPRGPLADVLRALAALPATVPIVAIDIPSGESPSSSSSSCPVLCIV